MQALRTNVSILDSASAFIVSWETGGIVMRFRVLEGVVGDYTQAMEYAAATGRPVLQCAVPPGTPRVAG